MALNKVKPPIPGSLLGRRKRGRPSAMIKNMTQMHQAAADMGMDTDSGSVDQDYTDGEPVLRMSFKKRRASKKVQTGY